MSDVNKIIKNYHVNPFLNFLKDYRRLHRNWKKLDQAMLTENAAKIWKMLEPRERSPYVHMAEQARKAVEESLKTESTQSWRKRVRRRPRWRPSPSCQLDTSDSDSDSASEMRLCTKCSKEIYQAKCYHNIQNSRRSRSRSR